MQAADESAPLSSIGWQRFVVVAGWFGEIREQGMMIDQPQRVVGAAGGLEADHDLGGFQRVPSSKRAAGG